MGGGYSLLELKNVKNWTAWSISSKNVVNFFNYLIAKKIQHSFFDEWYLTKIFYLVSLLLGTVVEKLSKYSISQKMKIYRILDFWL